MILLIYFLVVWLAVEESWSDYYDITNNMPIDHSGGWHRRALAIAMACAFCLCLGASVAGMVYAAIGAAFIFSAVFRYRLNTLRGLTPYYVSTSNIYDSVFIGLFGANAGRAAYVTEAMIAVAAIVVYY